MLKKLYIIGLVCLGLGSLSVGFLYYRPKAKVQGHTKYKKLMFWKVKSKTATVYLIGSEE